MMHTIEMCKAEPDYLALALAKADHYDVIADLLKQMFEAQSIREFFEAQQQLKRELKFIP